MHQGQNHWQFQLYLWINQMRYIESSIMPFKFQVIAKRNALLQNPNPNTEGSPLQYSLLTGPFPTYYSKSNWPQINVKGHMSSLLYAQSSADGAFPYHSHTLNSSDPILQITPNPALQIPEKKSHSIPVYSNIPSSLLKHRIRSGKYNGGKGAISQTQTQTVCCSYSQDN